VVSVPATLHGAALVLRAGALADLGAVVTARADGASRGVVITDDVVAPRWAAAARAGLGPLPVDLLEVPAGEASKTRETWAALTDRMIALGCGRDTVVVAVGGGVIGDLAGFVAATYHRGLPCVQVPTTLLAMVDAAIGGKTGVDTPAGKNLVGAFHHPVAVVIDPATLGTLPRRQLRNGLAECVKHGVIADAEYLARVVAAAPTLADPAQPAGAAMLDVIAGSVAIKAAVVAADAREAGRRKILNFGHTLGHALETASAFRLLHGEAIAVGMVLEADLAERLGVATPGTADAVRRAVRAVGLDPTLPRDLDPEVLLALTRTDKKARGGRVEYALPAQVGTMAGSDTGWAVPVADGAVRSVLAAARER
jgi:3-dehydroquinate synthase